MAPLPLYQNNHSEQLKTLFQNGYMKKIKIPATATNHALLAIFFRKTQIKIETNLILSFTTKGILFGCFPSYANSPETVKSFISKHKNKKLFLSREIQKRLFSAFLNQPSNSKHGVNRGFIKETVENLHAKQKPT
ncbi:MAG: hypothetical protein QW468_05600 [Candidatus Bathyarchaeia archaeon]